MRRRGREGGRRNGPTQVRSGPERWMNCLPPALTIATKGQRKRGRGAGGGGRGGGDTGAGGGVDWETKE